MNTNPDDAKLALWLDDELAGEELAQFEAWALLQPEHVAAREETRRWRKLIASAIPSSEEPPYPEFFNSRIVHGIREQSPKPAPIAPKRPLWKSWLMPMAACAGMVLTFWMGAKSQSQKFPEINVAGAPKAIPVEQIVYTPESGVNAELFASGSTSSMVIVLNGVAAIPDSMDFSATTYIPNERDFDSTAGNESETTEETH